MKEDAIKKKYTKFDNQKFKNVKITFITFSGLCSYHHKKVNNIWR
jgi:hypothetical protein